MVGKNIRRIRSEQHMTQVALAEKSGVSVQMINQIEWGVKGLSVYTLKRIASALGCSTDELLAEEETNGESVNQRAGC